MRILRLIPLLFLAIVLSSCNTLRGSYIDKPERTVEFLLADMPLPPDTEFVEDPIIMGTGGGVTGKIVLHSPVSPISNLDFYTSVSKTSGWRLVASTISKKIDLKTLIWVWGQQRMIILFMHHIVLGIQKKLLWIGQNQKLLEWHIKVQGNIRTCI